MDNDFSKSIKDLETHLFSTGCKLFDVIDKKAAKSLVRLGKRLNDEVNRKLEEKSAEIQSDYHNKRIPRKQIARQKYVFGRLEDMRDHTASTYQQFLELESAIGEIDEFFPWHEKQVKVETND